MTIAALGILVELSKLTRPVQLKIGDHNHPEDWDYDPKTGKKLWKKYLGHNPNLFPGIKLSEEFSYDYCRIAGYKVLPVNQKYCCVALCSLHVYADDKLKSIKDPSGFDDFKAEMKFCGLWNDSYGLHLWNIEV